MNANMNIHKLLGLAAFGYSIISEFDGRLLYIFFFSTFYNRSIDYPNYVICLKIKTLVHAMFYSPEQFVSFFIQRILNNLNEQFCGNLQIVYGRIWFMSAAFHLYMLLFLYFLLHILSFSPFFSVVFNSTRLFTPR